MKKLKQDYSLVLGTKEYNEQLNRVCWYSSAFARATGFSLQRGHTIHDEYEGSITKMEAISCPPHKTKFILELRFTDPDVTLMSSLISENIILTSIPEGIAAR